VSYSESNDEETNEIYDQLPDWVKDLLVTLNLAKKEGYDQRADWQRAISAFQGSGWLQPWGLGPSYLAGMFGRSYRAGYLGQELGGVETQYREKYAGLEERFNDILGWRYTPQREAYAHILSSRMSYWQYQQEATPSVLAFSGFRAAGWLASFFNRTSGAVLPQWLGGYTLPTLSARATSTLSTISRATGPLRLYGGQLFWTGQRLRSATAMVPELQRAYAEAPEYTRGQIEQGTSFYPFAVTGLSEELKGSAMEWGLGQSTMYGIAGLARPQGVLNIAGRNVNPAALTRWQTGAGAFLWSIPI